MGGGRSHSRGHARAHPIPTGVHHDGSDGRGMGQRVRDRGRRRRSRPQGRRAKADALGQSQQGPEAVMDDYTEEDKAIDVALRNLINKGMLELYWDGEGFAFEVTKKGEEAYEEYESD